jgi:hypothetical protein
LGEGLIIASFGPSDLAVRDLFAQDSNGISDR